MTNAELRSRRAAAAAAGKCSTCASRKPRDGMRTCDDCLRVASASAARRTMWCDECLRGDGLHRADCKVRA
jgi:hypothetical protein